MAGSLADGSLARPLGGLLPRFAEWVEGLGFWGPAVFIAGYVVTTVAFIPGAVMTLAAGAVFGLPKATAYVLTGATLGSAVAFLFSRHLAREAVAARVAGNARFAAIDRAVGTQGFKMVLLMRLSPVFPYNLLNYSLGLTTVRFTDYALASIGMLPGTLLYAYYGVLAGDVARLAGGRRARPGLLRRAGPRAARDHRGLHPGHPRRPPGAPRGRRQRGRALNPCQSARSLKPEARNRRDVSSDSGYPAGRGSDPGRAGHPPQERVATAARHR